MILFFFLHTHGTMANEPFINIKTQLQPVKKKKKKEKNDSGTARLLRPDDDNTSVRLKGHR